MNRINPPKTTAIVLTVATDKPTAIGSLNTIPVTIPTAVGPKPAVIILRNSIQTAAIWPRNRLGVTSCNAVAASPIVILAPKAKGHAIISTHKGSLIVVARTDTGTMNTAAITATRNGASVTPRFSSVSDSQPPAITPIGEKMRIMIPSLKPVSGGDIPTTRMK